MNVVVEQEDATIKGAIGDYWARVKAALMVDIAR